MSQLKINNLTKQFGTGSEQVTAVSDLSLSINSGEFVVLLGPSGCGKSTTLECIAGLQTPTEGEIILDGKQIEKQPPQERDIAMVFQNYALYPNMTVEENISFGLKMSSEEPAESIRQQAHETATMMGIEELLEDKPSELSGGQRQRVALGRAIVRDPAVFLLDEPLSNLDAKLRAEMRTEIERLQSELAVTTVYVTHNQTEAMTMADRVVIMNNGKIQQVGNPMECYYNPRSKFVAEFLGEPSMNFFDVGVDGTTLRGEEFEKALQNVSPDMLARHNEITCGIRPEAITIDTDQPSAISGTVRLVEPIGENSYVYVDTPDGEVITVEPTQSELTEGDSVSLTVPEERLHMFEQQSGKVIEADDTLTSSYA